MPKPIKGILNLSFSNHTEIKIHEELMSASLESKVIEKKVFESKKQNREN